jgi:cytochrome c556
LSAERCERNDFRIECGAQACRTPLISEKTCMKKAVPLVAAIAVAGAFSTAVLAQSADRAIKYRQGILQAMGWHMGILGGMAKGERPYDKDVATRSATFVDQLSAMPWDGFTPGSDSGAPHKSRPDVWKDSEKFAKAQQTLRAVTPKLVSAAGTDLSALRSAVGEVGRACTNCHDDFRAR